MMFFIMLFTFVFATIAIVFFIIFFRKAIQGYQQKYWSKTDGRILDDELLKKWYYHLYRGNWGRRYRLILKEYEYEVHGTTYVQREELGRVLEDFAIHKSNLTPIGSNVEVYYNPQNPVEATIEPGIKGDDYFNLFYGIFWLVMAGISFDPIYRDILRYFE